MPDPTATEEETGYDIPPPGGAPAKKVVTAFVVFIDENGYGVAHPDLHVLDGFEIDRPAQHHDMYQACSMVLADIQNFRTVQNTIAGMMQASAQMAEAQKNARIAENLAKKGIHLPPR